MATIAEGESSSPVITKAAYFALAGLATANLLNYLDRQIVSILAQAIKEDLKLDDAELGFILGTAFAVFYSVVGIAMGRISDGLPRKKVMAFGLSLWSVMTALGGAATSFATLGLVRIGVGVGEAVANPCSHSLLADIFPARRRAMAISVYLTGTFLGGALALVIGGYFLEHWDEFCSAVPIGGACSLPAWKATLIAVGLPGLPLALLLLLIREPPRAAQTAPVGRFVLGELATAIPPFTLVTIYRVGGSRGLASNLIMAAIISAAAAVLSLLTGDVAQWASFGLGAYAVVTWGQIQSYRDKPLFALTFGDPTFVLGTAAAALISCVSGAAGVWSAPYAMRVFDLAPKDIGLSLGVIHLLGSLFGVILGGWVTDRWKLRDKRAPLAISAISTIGTLPCILVMMLASDFGVFLAALCLLGIFGALWAGAIGAMIQDLVLPRMRGSAAASFSLVAIVISSGTGPYWVGKVSTMTGSLTAGVLSMLLLAPFALILLWLAARRLPLETPEVRRSRAEAAGEPPAN